MSQKNVHKITKRSVTPDGIKIQIEDWRHVYTGSYKTLSIGCYPIAKQDSRFVIKKGKPFRCSIENFSSNEEVLDIFLQLEYGVRKIEDFADRIRDEKYKYLLGLID